MKKTLLTFIIALLVTTGAWAQTTFTVDNLTYEIIDTTTRTVELTGYETEPTGTLTIPATVTHNSIEYSVTKIGQDALERCSALTAVTIPDGVTDIGSYAFFKCTALTTVNIGCSLTNIGEFVFDYCKALTQINVNEANSTYCSENGILFNKEKTTLLQYPAGKTETTYTVPGSVTIIGENAFAYCAALTQIILQEGVTTIDYYAFDECTALTQITLPQSLTSIERYAFADCTALTAMTVLATVPPSVVLSNAFQNVSRDIPVYVPAASLTAYQAAEVWNEFTNLQAIGTTGLPTAVMPESIIINGGQLHNPQGLYVSLYDMQGRLVYSGNDTVINQPAGVYVIRCADSNCKVLF